MEKNIKLTANAVHDAGLVIAARSGDEKAYAKLMNRYKNAIYFRVLKMVDYEIDAEELTIETFGKAFTNINQYDEAFAFSTWLFRIAYNHALDHLRKKRVVTIPLEMTILNEKWIGIGDDYKLSESDNPEEALIKKQNAMLLRKSVSCLKPKYRTILEMRYFKEYSYNEIAQELNLPLVTVKVQLFRSHEILFNLLKKTDVSDKYLI